MPSIYIKLGAVTVFQTVVGQDPVAEPCGSVVWLQWAAHCFLLFVLFQANSPYFNPLTFIIHSPTPTGRTVCKTAENSSWTFNSYLWFKEDHDKADNLIYVYLCAGKCLVLRLYWRVWLAVCACFLYVLVCLLGTSLVTDSLGNRKLHQLHVHQPRTARIYLDPEDPHMQHMQLQLTWLTCFYNSNGIWII